MVVFPQRCLAYGAASKILPRVTVFTRQLPCSPVGTDFRALAFNIIFKEKIHFKCKIVVFPTWYIGEKIMAPLERLWKTFSVVPCHLELKKTYFWRTHWHTKFCCTFFSWKLKTIDSVKIKMIVYLLLDSSVFLLPFSGWSSFSIFRRGVAPLLLHTSVEAIAQYFAVRLSIKLF